MPFGLLRLKCQFLKPLSGFMSISNPFPALRCHCWGGGCCPDWLLHHELPRGARNVCFIQHPHRSPHLPALSCWLCLCHRGCRWAVKSVPGWEQRALLWHFCCHLLPVGANINVAVGQNRLEHWSGWKQTCQKTSLLSPPAVWCVQCPTGCASIAWGWEASAVVQGCVRNY